MSSEKLTKFAISKKILDRLKLIHDFTYDKELAQLFGMSPESLVNKRKTGSLLTNIIIAGINKNVNLNWLITGEGEPYNKDREGEIPEDDPWRELLIKTRLILESKTGYSNSLAANIESFYDAIETKKKLNEHEKRLEHLEGLHLEEEAENHKKGEAA